MPSRCSRGIAADRYPQALQPTSRLAGRNRYFSAVPTEVLDPVLGDPIDVSAAGRTLESIAVDVASIAARLRSLASSTEWTGTAAHSAYARSATVPPKLDKAQASYSAAGVALRTYARSLDEAQQQSESAIASANRASADLAAARGSQVAAANHDAVAVATAQAAGLPPPAPTAPRYQASIEDAAARLSRARALNDQAHDLQRRAAQVAAGALQQASHEGIRNESWMHRIAHSAGQWASTHWAAALHQVARVANTVSALAGLAALVLAVAGVLFPPLEVAAGVLETVALASAVVAGMADTALAVTGRGSWKLVGIDVLGLAPAGLGKVVTKLAPVLRESRLIRPSTVVHASSGDAAKLRSLTTLGHPPGASYSRVINCAPSGVDPEWGLTADHIDKHFLGEELSSLSRIDAEGNVELWLSHLRELATRPYTALRNGGIQDIIGSFTKTDGSGSFRLGLRISPRDDGTFDLVTVLTAQRRRPRV